MSWWRSAPRGRVIDFEPSEQAQRAGIGLVTALEDAAARVGADPRVDIVVVRGNGRSFCAGLDLDMFAAEGMSLEFYRRQERGVPAAGDHGQDRHRGDPRPLPRRRCPAGRRLRRPRREHRCGDRTAGGRRGAVPRHGALPASAARRKGPGGIADPHRPAGRRGRGLQDRSGRPRRRGASDSTSSWPAVVDTYAPRATRRGGRLEAAHRAVVRRVVRAGAGGVGGAARRLPAVARSGACPRRAGERARRR